MRGLRGLGIQGLANPVFSAGCPSEINKWWLSGGIPDANCIAAYQPKGAASYATSKVNLANPGTYDLSDGAAFPTWDVATGWKFVTASSQYLTIPTAIISSVPISMVCRFNADSEVPDYTLMSICDVDAVAYFCIKLYGPDAANPVRSFVAAAGATASAASSTGYTAGNWFTGAAVEAAINSRAAYIDGGSKGTSAVSRTPVGLDSTYIGALYSFGTGIILKYSGYISACAFYNIATSDAQVLALHTAMAAL